ncbi:alpha/beta-hydrolase [Aspergillus avenaceus]|uniref:Alpha/beta-hydrolase n=1 Tax=Aspergillus avenaceus TaxID=36643 RepID=A0A5N6U446_ASPAV|nr:alpha/beta-hydrolase [Aspergillus avenaceus]
MSRYKVIEHTVRCQHVRGRPGATEPYRSGDLRMAVKQYVPESNQKPTPGDVTVIGAHGNGLTKELYEPLWDDLHEELRKKGRRIRSIWIADVVNQGRSGVLNEMILGDDPSLFDHARDLLFLVNQYQDEIPQPIVGIGHSMGGMHLAYLSLIHPDLFQALILIDPVIQRENIGRKYAVPATYRRDVWPSRQDAIARFRRNKVFENWDTRAFERYTECAFRDLPTELYPDARKHGDHPVTLTTTQAQESYMYMRPSYADGKIGLREGEWRVEMHPEDRDETYPFYSPTPARIFRRLEELKPSVLYMFGEHSPLSTPDLRQAKLEHTGMGVEGNGGRSVHRVKEVILSTGHLVPMEKVHDCAMVAARFTDTDLSRWEDEERKFLEKWDSIPRRQKISLGDRWKQNIGHHSRKSLL